MGRPFHLNVNALSPLRHSKPAITTTKVLLAAFPANVVAAAASTTRTASTQQALQEVQAVTAPAHPHAITHACPWPLATSGPR